MKPILYSTNAFDSGFEHDFKFSWTGNQAFKNRLRIYKNIDNTLVYDTTQTTMQLFHVLPANILVNGIEYNCEISVFDNNNLESEFSTKVIFKCLTNPSYSFTNLTSGQIVKNATFSSTLLYSQTQGELLDSYNISLYDNGQKLVYKSDTKYDTDVLSDTLSGLNDNSQYYLRSEGITINGMTVDTGLIQFSVEYLKPSIFSKIPLENVNGGIKISCNIIIVTGECSIENPTYIDNKKIDLTNEGVTVTFDEGFNITDNFTMQYVGCDFTNYSTILEYTAENKNLTLTYYKALIKGESVEKVYVNLKVKGSVTTYTIVSNRINVPLETDMLNIWIRKINNLYEVKLTNLGGV